VNECIPLPGLHIHVPEGRQVPSPLQPRGHRGTPQPAPVHAGWHSHAPVSVLQMPCRLQPSGHALGAAHRFTNGSHESLPPSIPPSMPSSSIRADRRCTTTAAFTKGHAQRPRLTLDAKRNVVISIGVSLVLATVNLCVTYTSIWHLNQRYFRRRWRCLYTFLPWGAARSDTRAD
jgi:hypothetical protein